VKKCFALNVFSHASQLKIFWVVFLNKGVRVKIFTVGSQKKTLRIISRMLRPEKDRKMGDSVKVYMLKVSEFEKTNK
jgi:hypothetical protein